jgi:hypothetical protein
MRALPGQISLACHIGAAAHARQALAPDGTLMLVEPVAGDALADNLHPLGRLYYAASTVLCTPGDPGPRCRPRARQPDRRGPPAQLLRRARHTHVRRAAVTPFNLVLEVRP